MKIKWNRIAVALLFIASLYLLLHDFYLLGIKPWFTQEMYSWTRLGFITFIFAMIICIQTFEQLKEWWEEL